MDERVEITDEASERAWLETQDHQTQVWFATRCTLRALPKLGTWPDATSSGLAFAACRAMLISAAAATCSPAEMKGLVDSAANSAAAAANAAHSAARSANDAAHSAADSAAHSAATFDANAPKNWEKLWPVAPQPDGLAQAWEALKAQWDADGPHWSFWIDWYEAVRDGTWTNWDLIFRIASEVSEEDWDAGPARVAERIVQIQAACNVQRLATEVAEAAYLAHPGTPGVGHNNPPSLIDDNLSTQPPETIIWVAASELRDQAASETPDKSKVQRAGGLLVGALKAAGIWVAGTIAAGITTVTIAVLKKGADVWAVQNQDKLLELIDAAAKWLTFLN